MTERHGEHFQFPMGELVGPKASITEVASRAAAQAARYEDRIINQRDSINRLLADPSVEPEIRELHERLAIWQARCEAAQELLSETHLAFLNAVHPVP